MKVSEALSEALRRGRATKVEMADCGRRLKPVLTECLGVTTGTQLAFNLANAYAAAGRMRDLVEQLGKTRQTRSAVRRALTALDVEVFEIGRRHRAHLRRPLTAALDRLYGKRRRAKP